MQSILSIPFMDLSDDAVPPDEDRCGKVGAVKLIGHQLVVQKHGVGQVHFPEKSGNSRRRRFHADCKNFEAVLPVGAVQCLERGQLFAARTPAHAHDVIHAEESEDFNYYLQG